MRRRLSYWLLVWLWLWVLWGVNTHYHLCSTPRAGAFLAASTSAVDHHSCSLCVAASGFHGVLGSPPLLRVLPSPHCLVVHTESLTPYKLPYRLSSRSPPLWAPLHNGSMQPRIEQVCRR